MAELRFWMAGSNGWHKFFPGKQAYAIYEYMYQQPRTVEDIAGNLKILEEEVKGIVSKWVEVGFAKRILDRILGQVPVITDPDYVTLNPWFQYVAECTNETTRSERGNYQDLAVEISAGQDQRSIDNVLSILICASTLDVGTLSRLEKGLMGEPPKRGEKSRDFFWGKKIEKRLGYLFGVNSYGSGKDERWCLSMIHSRVVDRTPLQSFYSKFGDEISQVVKLLGALAENPRYLHELPAMVSWDSKRLRDLIETLMEVRVIASKEPYRLLIPVFDQKTGPRAKEICERTSTVIAKKIEDNLDQLRELVEKCSFSHCPFGDIFCMIFHEGYDYAADELLNEGVIPPFPSKAGAEWGMWMSRV